MAKPKENTERINVFLSPSVIEVLKVEAAEKGMTVSGLIRMIVLAYLREK